MAIIEESFQGFVDLSWTLKDQFEIAKAQKGVAKELKQSFKARLEKITEENSKLRKDLC